MHAPLSYISALGKHPIPHTSHIPHTRKIPFHTMRKYAISVLALAMGTLSCTAQTSSEQAPTGSWTLEQCIQYALQHNIQMKQDLLSKAQNEEQLKQSQAALFPSLSFSTNQYVSWRPFSESYVNLSSGTMTTTSSEVTTTDPTTQPN